MLRDVKREVKAEKAKEHALWASFPKVKEEPGPDEDEPLINLQKHPGTP